MKKYDVYERSLAASSATIVAGELVEKIRRGGVVRKGAIESEIKKAYDSFVNPKTAPLVHFACVEQPKDKVKIHFDLFLKILKLAVKEKIKDWNNECSHPRSWLREQEISEVQAIDTELAIDIMRANAVAKSAKKARQK
ncbi:MAG: hypothetical protein FWD15_05290 [Alphaproteobacteria bacterium]|nr:hypothetical protein [Alphaproteobacteria bacterium]